MSDQKSETGEGSTADEPKQLEPDLAAKSDPISDDQEPDNDQEPNQGTWWSAGLSSNTFSSWYASAKQKSSQAYEFMKKDLTELKDTVKQESAPYLCGTASAVSNTANYVKSTINLLVEDDLQQEEQDVYTKSSTTESLLNSGDKLEETTLKPEQPQEKWPESLTVKMASVFSSFVDAISPQLGDDSDDEVIVGGRLTIPRTRWETLLHAIQIDSNTYCHEPDGPAEDFEAWMEKFSLIDHEPECANLLATVSEMDQFYKKLVPKELTHDDFWHRYYYRVELLKLLEARRLAAKHKEHSPQTGSVGQKEQVTVKLLTEAAQETESDSKESITSSSGTANSIKSRATSDDWEKADLDDIVDEATKKVADKLASAPPTQPTKSDEENEWEFE